jgi:hypothetical protein
MSRSGVPIARWGERGRRHLAVLNLAVPLTRSQLLATAETHRGSPVAEDASRSRRRHDLGPGFDAAHFSALHRIARL